MYIIEVQVTVKQAHFYIIDLYYRSRSTTIRIIQIIKTYETHMYIIKVQVTFMLLYHRLLHKKQCRTYLTAVH